MTTHWIDTPEAVRELCDDIADETMAVDTESDHFHAYDAQVCLIQIATEEVTALVDPLALDAADLEPLFDLFASPNNPKVLHAARNDILELDRDYGATITNLFDTRIAARFLAYEKNGLSWMLRNVLDVDANGEFSRYDWTTRPISDPARQYALEDVRHLLRLRNRFSEELRADGWMEPFRQQCRYITESVEYVDSEFDTDGWRKLRGTSGLNGRQRAALDALYRWRHRLCTRLNRAAVEVFPNGTIMELAAALPEDPQQLATLDGVDQQFAERHGEDILEVIDESKTASVPPKRRPRSPSKRPPRRQRECYDALRSWRNETADRLDLPPEYIATNDTLSQIAQSPPDSPEELTRFVPILKWHREMFGQKIVEIASAGHPEPVTTEQHPD